MNKLHFTWMLCGAYGIKESDVKVREDFVRSNIAITIRNAGDVPDKLKGIDVCDSHVPLNYCYTLKFNQFD